MAAIITEHAVCALPADHRDWRYLVIRVQRIGATDRWIVKHAGSYLTPYGDWTAMSRTYAAEFSEHDALAAAEEWAARVDVDGLTATHLINR